MKNIIKLEITAIEVGCGESSNFYKVGNNHVSEIKRGCIPNILDGNNYLSEILTYQVF